jgi:hypothetical protein
MVVACKSAKRWFDLDAVRHENARSEETGGGQKRERARLEAGLSSGTNIGVGLSQNPAGAPPLDHWWYDQLPQDAWLIPTQPYKGSHYATWPESLCVTPIEAMCPRRVCKTCGKPSERITKPSDEYDAARCKGDFFGKGNNDRDQGLQGERLNGRPNAEYVTLGWSDCGHDNDWRPGLVLDPFAGSGTTLQVATGHGRDAIGIDLDARNAHLAQQRCGMFLTIEGDSETDLTPRTHNAAQQPGNTVRFRAGYKGQPRDYGATIDTPTGDHL